MSNDDVRSEAGDFGGLFDASAGVGTGGHGSGSGRAGASDGGSHEGGLKRVAADVGSGWGKGPVPIDTRKFKYDVLKGISMGNVSFNATKADTMDAVEAGEMLHRLHEHYGIHKELENRIRGFDKALWYEHTINGASQLQPGRGFLYVGDVNFDIAPIKNILGVDMRRFFRAFADEIIETNREILYSYDEYDVEMREKAVRVRAVAAKRGLGKFPWLAADSSEAALILSNEERAAVLVAKPFNLPAVDVVAESNNRVVKAAGAARELKAE